MTTAKTKGIHSFSRECIVFYINREYEYDKCVDMPHREIEKKKKEKKNKTECCANVKSARTKG